jgi:hypothetical protein
MSLEGLVLERCLYKNDDGPSIAMPDEWQTNLAIDLGPERLPRSLAGRCALMPTVSARVQRVMPGFARRRPISSTHHGAHLEAHSRWRNLRCS